MGDVYMKNIYMLIWLIYWFFNKLELLLGERSIRICNILH